MDGPRFRVLDVVVIRDRGRLGRLGLAGRRGAVAQIRRYGDGSYRYALGSEDAGVGGLYYEDDLESTGEQAPVALFQLPGPFRERDVVRISDEFPDASAAGRQGVINGSYADDDGELLLGVSNDEVGEAFCVPSRFLTPTGERRPRGARERQGRSSRVSETGMVVGHDSYVIVDEIEHYI